MPDQNLCLLMGRLTRDPEVKHTSGGMAICDLGLAINEKRKQGNEWVEKTTFCDVVCFGRQAEFIADKSRKGDCLHVTGRLELDTWDDKATGQKRSKLKIIGDRVQLLGSRQSDSRPSGQSQGSAYVRDSQKAFDGGRSAPADDDFSDIPF